MSLKQLDQLVSQEYLDKLLEQSRQVRNESEQQAQKLQYTVNNINFVQNSPQEKDEYERAEYVKKMAQEAENLTKKQEQKNNQKAFMKRMTVQGVSSPIQSPKQYLKRQSAIGYMQSKTETFEKNFIQVPDLNEIQEVKNKNNQYEEQIIQDANKQFEKKQQQKNSLNKLQSVARSLIKSKVTTLDESKKRRGTVNFEEVSKTEFNRLKSQSQNVVIAAPKRQSVIQSVKNIHDAIVQSDDINPELTQGLQTTNLELLTQQQKKLNQQIETLRQKNDQLRSNNQLSKNSLYELESKISLIQNEIHAKLNQNELLRLDITQYQKESQFLEKQEQQKRQYAEIERLQFLLDNQDQKNNQLFEKNGKSSEQNQQLQQEHQQLQQNIRKKIFEIEQARIRLQNIENESHFLISENNDLKRQKNPGCFS